MLAFRGGQMGCFTLRFSHDGLMLAAACADKDAYPVVGEHTGAWMYREGSVVSFTFLRQRESSFNLLVERKH